MKSEPDEGRTKQGGSSPPSGWGGRAADGNTHGPKEDVYTWFQGVDRFTLDVTVVRASGILQMDLMSKSDPFVEVSEGGVAMDAGCTGAGGWHVICVC